ncbi:unannotated protein [freshwater metagenome]|uniref:Unannotated protein n=1 Tax=freshwater metagenome TaxID=449393 RepID=A0A6J7CTT5_9ZZZZ|nr:SRPBCC domain-containing protein [Actinomycetota bacterium]
MTVTNIHKDLESLTMTVTAGFDAPVERVWQMWSNPRLLERWWGPPMFPATFVQHDLSPGAGVTYFMTGPDGDQYHGWWRVITVSAPHGLAFEDGFSDADGNPNLEMPTTMGRVTLESSADGGTSMSIASTFNSREQMEQLVDMGMEEGLAAAVGQIDDLLAE